MAQNRLTDKDTGCGIPKKEEQIEQSDIGKTLSDATSYHGRSLQGTDGTAFDRSIEL